MREIVREDAFMKRKCLKEQYVHGVTLFRKLYAENKNVLVLFEEESEKQWIEEIAERAFYPEVIKLQYLHKKRIRFENLSGRSMENIVLVYRYDEQKDCLSPCEQFGGLVDSRVGENQQIVMDPYAAICIEKTQKIIVCGGVDDGKSTLLGRLIFEALEESEQKKLIEEGRILRKDKSIDYALMTAESKEEEEQGITIEVTYSSVNTKIGRLTFADTPGHEQYTINMAKGAAFAQHAILMVAANQGMKDQTIKQLHICALMGIRNFIIAINKMDLCHYEQKVYQVMEHKILECMQRLPHDRISIVPVAAKKGDNITERSENMPWYQGETLLESLRNLTEKNDPDIPGSLFVVDRVCKPSQNPDNPIKKRAYLGVIKHGTFAEGESAEVFPGKQTVHITSVYKDSDRENRGCKNVAAALEFDREVDIRMGSCIVKNMKIEESSNLIAKLLWFQEKPLFSGRRLKLIYDNRTVDARVKTIRGIEDIRTGAFLKSHSIERNSISEVEIHLHDTISFCLAEREKNLRLFLLIDEKQSEIAGCGWFLHPVDKLREFKELSIADKRRQLMGHKSFVILCKEQEKIEQIEEALLGRGYHTVTLYAEEGNLGVLCRQMECLLEAGIIILLQEKGKQPEGWKEKLEERFPGVIRNYRTE